MLPSDAEYHGGIKRPRTHDITEAPKSLTCRNSGASLCRGGDLNPHAR